MPPPFIENLKKGEIALGFNLMYPVAGIIECIGAGWDWIWIDSQHGQHDYRSLLECVRVADACGVAPVVRVPGHEPGTIGRIIDMRPTGIMVPMVNTAQQAVRIVEAARFPPLGKRSFGGRRAIDLGERKFFQTANEDMLLMVQIETPEAVANAQAIAATNGVDALFFGPDDMKVRLEIPINTPAIDAPELVAAMDKVAAATKEAGKIAACVAFTPASLRTATSQGYRLIAGGSDVVFLHTAAQAALADLRRPLER